MMDRLMEANPFVYGDSATNHHTGVNEKDVNNRGDGGGRVRRPQLNVGMVPKVP